MKIAYLLRTIVEMICQIWKIFPIALVSIDVDFFMFIYATFMKIEQMYES